MTKWFLLGAAWLLMVSGGFYYLTVASDAKPQSTPQVKQAETKPVATPTPPTLTPTRQELLELTNKVRREAGLSEVREDPRLHASAQMKAEDESKYGYFGHVNPHTGKHGYEYIYETWPECKARSENIRTNIANFNTSSSTMHAWLASPPHKAGILRPENIAVGFGISGLNIVQHFCSQL